MNRGINLAVALLLALAMLVSSPALAFKFEIPVNSQRCFMEEVPSGTMFSVSYSAGDAKAQFVDVNLVDSFGTVLWFEEGKNTGTFSDTVTEGGDYILCFSSRVARNAQLANSKEGRSIVLSFKVGTENIDYRNLATKEKMKPIEVQMRALEDAVRGIHAEYIYFLKKEGESLRTNYHMRSKVLWMGVLVVAFFVAFTYWELRHLKLFFRKKRMID